MNIFDKIFKKNSNPEVELDSRSVPRLPFKDRVANYFKSRKFRHGGLATLLIILFIIAMIVVNIISGILVKRVPALSPDLSQNKIYSLGDQTLTILEEIPEDFEVEIEIFASELACEAPSSDLDPYGTIPQANELIKRYMQHSSKINITYTDLVKTPAAGSKYGTQYSGLIKDYYIAVSSYRVAADGSRTMVHVKLTSFYDMLPHLVDDSYNTTSSGIITSLVETTMTSQIKTVCQNNIPKVAFLVGNDNRSGNNLKGSLDTNGFDVAVTDINLMTEEIPDDIDTAVLVAPMRDLSIDEVRKLEEFLANDDNLGKNLVYFASATMSETPTLDSFLTDWGIEVTRDIVYETDRTWVSSSQANIFLNSVYKNETFARDLETRSLYVAMDRPLNINILDSDRASSLLSTTLDGVVFPNRIAADLSSVTEGDKSERVTAAMGTKTVYDAESVKHTSNVVVFGTDSMYNTSFYGSDAYANQEYLLNIFNELSGITEITEYITPSTLLAKDFEVSLEVADAIAVIFQYIIPALLIIIGTYVFFRRRYL